MNFQQLKKELKRLKEKGFIPTRRRGDTGVGHTLEKELGVSENNIPIPDAGGRVELKASRRQSTSAITLFTYDRRVWKISNRELVEKYGYIDSDSRPALYSSVRFRKPNSQGLFLTIDKSGRYLLLNHEEKVVIAEWKISHVVAKLLSKMPRLLFALANTRLGTDGKEEFHYVEALLCDRPSDDKFIEAIKDSSAFVDIRMHLKPNKVARNHGTAFRVAENKMFEFYAEKKKLL